MDSGDAELFFGRDLERLAESFERAVFRAQCLVAAFNFRHYFTTTCVTCISGYAWFHCVEMRSKVRRKGLLWPGARGESVKSTASSYGPAVRRTRNGVSSRCAVCPMSSLKVTWTTA